MPLDFNPSPSMTLGVEIELQLIDPTSRDLTPAAPALFERLGARPSIKPELFRSMVEIATGVCGNVAAVREQLETALATLRSTCRELGVVVAGGGAHPFAKYRDRIPYPRPRYEGVIEREQWIARRLCVFGLHLHLGMRDGDHAIRMMNALLPYSPHLLALSASSPFWEGADTGLADTRVTVFESLPTAGVPPTFERWSDFVETYEALMRTGSIRSIKDLWWDVRPHPDLGTLELRICDTPQTMSEIVAVVALGYCLAAWLDESHRQEAVAPRPAALWLRQNKWRVARHGLEADLVVDNGASVAPLRREVERLLAALEPTARRLGAADELSRAAFILATGPGYARQRAAFRTTGSLTAVADLLVAELETDLPGVAQDAAGATA
jgi:carboxylate-amine ligase